MEAQALLAFALAFFVFAASPGPDNMTIMARTVSHGAPSGIAYGVGTVIGILIYLALAALGLSLIASEMGFAMTALRYGGAAYLIYVGIRLWTVKPVIAEIAEPQRRRDLFTVCLTAIALNLGNPKMPLFYLALLPNFVGADFSAGAYLSLAAVIVSVEMVVVTGHVWIAGRARRLLRTPRIITAVNRGAGTVLAGAGIAVIATHRSS
ncbi:MULTISPECIES: LysE family translocator [Alphaproteobacteria]|uniref:Lysine exporter protein LysE/YggA n=2 Tax=Alphaproteobacteria TaxID=28211 RepID=A0A512HCN6_9HYPH|nr:MULTISPECIES: LysE family translocator [Alphaproteobacteria]GEO83217.1 lysine exporter protein LysE/YggA [Ciceribacter naphthalenivorans]GLR20388.1 lysine exporter protein LysE/YggA [Ciceribacter naphthalenivorans]GLT03244.1 lysine exporter protein LysE/YggA [Sphingomonas psychrolutea]